MASRPHRSKVDRLPVDFEQPRSQHQMSPSNDFGAELGPLVNNTEEMRLKALMAVTYVHQQGEDSRETRAKTGMVMFALGLAEPPKTPRHVSGPIDVDCPQCGVPTGRRCVSMTSGNPIGGNHTPRQRKAAQLREGS